MSLSQYAIFCVEKVWNGIRTSQDQEPGETLWLMDRHLPDEILVFMAGKFRMLADPTRLAILRELMSAEERNVGQVVTATGGTQANVSKHLKLLAEAGMVARRKEGLNVLYRLDDPVIEKICHLVCETTLNELKAQVAQRQRLLRRRGKGDQK